jgi:N-formylglutamate amidohydrolase
MSSRCTLLLCLAAASLRAAGPAPQFDARHYVEYQEGTLPLILGSPHGGNLKPDEIKERSSGVREADANTQDLARRIQAKLIAKTGGSPFMVISHLHRNRLDPNREVVEAAQGDPIAVETWKHYHDRIEQAEAEVKKRFPTGLYIDVHGQRHKEKRVELGYTISAEKLRMGDDKMEAATLLIRQCSIRDLDQRSPKSFVELLRGKSSLGGLLEAKGYLCVPSPAVSAPKEMEEYFMGGYTVDQHGSRDGRTINAVQIESPYDGVRDTAQNREKFATALAEVLPVYFRTHFGIELAPAK